jgi:hypothetical protein
MPAPISVWGKAFLFGARHFCLGHDFPAIGDRTIMVASVTQESASLSYRKVFDDNEDRDARSFQTAR